MHNKLSTQEYAELISQSAQDVIRRDLYTRIFLELDSLTRTANYAQWSSAVRNTVSVLWI